MRLHPRCVVVLMLLLVPATAQAHRHVWDVAFGPAAATSNSWLVGGRFSIGLTNKVPDNEKLSWLIDVTNLKEVENDEHTTLLSYLGGPRWALVGDDHHIFMVHSLIGLTQKLQGATVKTDYPVTVGAAYEWAWGEYKAGQDGWAARVQAEHSFFPWSDSLKRYTQISASLVRRFE
ncbi:MAG TPA: hypothetical protein VJ691_02145 [Vicinamibacterales bacterium]|nr:hypothetical protein [Vicinamibacterales bacterium]